MHALAKNETCQHGYPQKVGSENFHAKIDFRVNLSADFLESFLTSQTYSSIKVSVVFPVAISAGDMRAELSSLCASHSGEDVRRKAEQSPAST